jgi:hypothetical protein
MKHVKLFEDFDDPLDPEIRDLFGLNSRIEVGGGIYYLTGPSENEAYVIEIIEKIDKEAQEEYRDTLKYSGESLAMDTRDGVYHDRIPEFEDDFKKLGYKIEDPYKE